MIALLTDGAESPLSIPVADAFHTLIDAQEVAVSCNNPFISVVFDWLASEHRRALLHRSCLASLPPWEDTDLKLRKRVVVCLPSRAVASLLKSFDATYARPIDDVICRLYAITSADDRRGVRAAIEWCRTELKQCLDTNQRFVLIDVTVHPATTP